MADRSISTPEEQVRALYEQTESQTAQAFEELVSKPSFGLLLARSAENVAAITSMSTTRIVTRSTAGANMCLLPGIICRTMEMARRTAPAASVTNTTILCTKLSASQPFSPSSRTPTAITDRKVIAQPKSKMGEGANGRIGLRSPKMPVWIRRNRLSVGRGPSSALSSKRVRLRQRSQ